MFAQPDLALWDEAITFLYNDQPEKALENLKSMSSHSAKTMFNIAVAYRRMGNCEDAIKTLTKATEMDPHLVIAYLERGNMNFRLKRYADALKDFELGQAKFGGHQFIDYSQLGLKMRLYQKEFINRQKDCKCVLEGGDPVQSTPEYPSREIAFRPPQNKIANMHKMDYLGKPKVVTVLDMNDNFTGFSGLKKLAAVNSAPTSPVVNRKDDVEAPSSHSPITRSPRPTRPAPPPPPPNTQTERVKLESVTPLTPPPRRQIHLRRVPKDTNQSDNWILHPAPQYMESKAPKPGITGSKESVSEIPKVSNEEEDTSHVETGDDTFIQGCVTNYSHDSI